MTRVMTPAARERARVRTPLVLLSVAVWVLLFEMSHRPGPMIDSLVPGHAPGLGVVAAVVSVAVSWVLMVVAMMAPLLVAPVGHVWAQSFVARRIRAVGLFLCGYLAVWTLVGLALVGLGLAVLRAGVAPPVAVGVVAGAVGWQCSPVKQRCLNRLRAHPGLAAFGRAADLDACRFGCTHGAWCAGSCWALMLLTVLAPWGMSVMLAAMAWFVAERLDRPQPPGWRVRVPARAARLAVAHLRRASSSSY